MISELSPDDVPWVPDDAEAEPEVPVEQPDKQADKAIIAARMQVVVLYVDVLLLSSHNRLCLYRLYISHIRRRTIYLQDK